MGLGAKIKDFKWGYILLAVICAATGVCMFAYNNTSLTALAITVGVVMILASIILAVLSFSDRSRGLVFGFRIALSVIMLVTGIVALVSKDSTIDVLVGIFGLLFIMDGSYKFHTSAISHRYRKVFWWVLLLLSAILIGGGFITVRFLTIEYPITVYVLGSLFVTDAIANLISAFYAGLDEK